MSTDIAAKDKMIEQLLRENETLKAGRVAARATIEEMHMIDRIKTREMNVLIAEVRQLQAERDTWIRNHDAVTVELLNLRDAAQQAREALNKVVEDLGDTPFILPYRSDPCLCNEHGLCYPHAALFKRLLGSALASLDAALGEPDDRASSAPGSYQAARGVMKLKAEEEES